MEKSEQNFSEDFEKTLLGGEREFSRKQIAENINISQIDARKIWRTLGFPNIEDYEVVFTKYDQNALDTIFRLNDLKVLNEEAVASLTRAIGQTTDRLVSWEFDTLLESLISTNDMVEVDAAKALLEALPDFVESLEKVLIYTWRRQLAFAVGRLQTSIEEKYVDGVDKAAPVLPLARAVGFADLVSYTRLSQRLDEKELATLVQRFQQCCSDVITVGGGRLVKTVGDEVLFVADTPEAGAEIALGLSQMLSEDKLLPEARLSMVWGGVLSRLGDVFGSTVNLASRINGLAKPGTFLVDAVTAQILVGDERFVLTAQDKQYVRGFGAVDIVLVSRGVGCGILNLVD